MATKIFRTYQDYSREKSTVTIPVPDAILQAAIDAVWAAVDVMSVGAPNLTGINSSVKLGNAPAVGTTAQRENKILVRYEDTVTFNTFEFSIPCADFGAMDFVANTDYLDLALTPQSDLVSVLEANMVTPDGNSANILSMQYVGRNI